MPLSNQEKFELESAALWAIDRDEPEAFIAALVRVGRRKATDSSLTERERQRWQAVANALDTAQASLDTPASETASQTAQTAPSADNAPQSPPVAPESAQEPDKHSDV